MKTLFGRNFVSTCLWILLIVSVGFGLVKSAKKVLHSWPGLFEKQQEPGDDARRVREWMDRHLKVRDSASVRLKYVTNRVDLPGQRPGSQYCYDAQFGMAPYLLYVREQVPVDYYLLDFTDPGELAVYLKKHQLRALFGYGTMTLVESIR